GIMLLQALRRRRGEIEGCGGKKCRDRAAISAAATAGAENLAWRALAGEWRGADAKKGAPAGCPLRRPGGTLLLKQTQQILRSLVGLGQGGNRRLHEDLLRDQLRLLGS